jgi:hypothetical protein
MGTPNEMNVSSRTHTMSLKSNLKSSFTNLYFNNCIFNNELNKLRGNNKNMS